MSNSTLILPRDLKGSSIDERNQLYIGRYGFTLEEITNLQRMSSGFTKLESICNAIISHSTPKIVDPGKVGSQLTLDVIAGLYDNPSDDGYTDAISHVRGVLRSRYDAEKRDQSDPNLQFTTTHFLRQAMGVYIGNLPEARRIGYDFVASDFDLKESIKLPLELGFYEALLIGIAYSEAYIHKPLRKASGNLTFRGTNYDDELPLYKVITRLLKSQYNYITEVSDEPRETREGRKFIVPRIQVYSSAIYTWFSNHLNFPSGEEREDLNFPDYFNQSDLNRLGFFVGYVGAKGKIAENGNWLRVHSTNKKFLESIFKIAQDNGVTSSLLHSGSRGSFGGDKDQYLLRIHKSGIDAMYDRKLLINPSHLTTYLLDQVR